MNFSASPSQFNLRPTLRAMPASSTAVVERKPCSMSAAGEVLVSRTVRDLARTSAGVVFEDRGEHALKGIGEAVRVYAVRKDGA